MSLDLQRLRVYIGERVRESERLASANVPAAVVRAHLHSARVGRDILAEIAEVEAKDEQAGV